MESSTSTAAIINLLVSRLNERDAEIQKLRERVANQEFVTEVVRDASEFYHNEWEKSRVKHARATQHVNDLVKRNKDLEAAIGNLNALLLSYQYCSKIDLSLLNHERDKHKRATQHIRELRKQLNDEYEGSITVDAEYFLDLHKRFEKEKDKHARATDRLRDLAECVAMLRRML